MARSWLIGALLGAAVVLGGNGASARGGSWADKDDCAPDTRHRKAEWGPVFQHSKRLAKLDCHGLAMDAEGIRHHLNLETLRLYNRPLVPPPPASTTPSPAFSAPALMPSFPGQDETPAPDSR